MKQRVSRLNKNTHFLGVFMLECIYYMKRVLSIFSSTHTVGQASLIIAFFTLISQCLALIRDVLFARVVGVGPTLDIYFSAFRVPDMLYVVLSSFVVATVLVPLLYEKEKESKESEQQFIKTVLLGLLISTIFLTSLTWLLVPVFAHLLVPPESVAATSEYVSVTRLLLLSPLLLTISAFFGSINQKTHTFLSFAISPVVYNLGIIFGIIYLYPHMGTHGLVAGVLVGCLMHVAVQFLGAQAYAKHSFAPRIRTDLSQLKKLIQFSFPRSAALFLAQAQMFILVGTIAYVGVGSVSSFFFAYNMQSVFLSLIGATISVALFSTLTRAHAEENFEGYHMTLSQGIQTIIFFSLPVTVLGILLAPDLAHLVFGAATAESMGMTYVVPTLFAIALISVTFQSLSLLFARAHYATKNSSIPLIAQIIPTLMFGILYVYSQYVDVSGNVNFLMLATGVFSIAAFIQSVVLYATLPRHSVQEKALKNELTKIMSGAFVGMIIILVVNMAISKTFILSSFFAILLKSVGITICFIVPYLWVLQKLESGEFQKIKHAITTRFKS